MRFLPCAPSDQEEPPSPRLGGHLGMVHRRQEWTQSAWNTIPGMVLDGYVRVSRTRGRRGETFISPASQREQILKWAEATGARLARIYEELDESGARADRPILAEVLARVEAGVSEGIVVAAFDRFGRSLLESLASIERIQSAGGTFVSVREGLDLTTDTGRLVLRIMLSMAEWELHRLRGRWNSARERAVARGVHMGVHPPTGYFRDCERRLHPDPQSGPIITEVFARRAAGSTIKELALFLKDRAIPTPAGNVDWAPAALHALLKNRVYLGELHHGSIVNRGSHLALTDPATWQAAQNPRVIPRRRRDQSATVLGGLLRCAGCQMVMYTRTITTKKGRNKRIYYCRGSSSAGACPARAWIAGTVAEPYVDATFFTLAARRRTTPRTARMRTLVEASERATREMLEYRNSQKIRSTLGRERFAEGLRERTERVRLATLAIDSERSRAATLKRPTTRELEARWPALGVDERRTAMSELIDCVFVFPGEPGGSDPTRLFVCARGDAPLDLPHRGRRSKPIQPFSANDASRTIPFDNERAWPNQRIRRGLEEFLAEQRADTWPTEEEFICAGRGPLLRQLNKTGGAARWTSGTSRSQVRCGKWTDERMRAVLQVIAAGRTTWPTGSEFKALGYQGLYSVLGRRGRRRWATELGLKYRNTGGAALRWTEPRVTKTLVRLCSGRETYPSQSQFAAEGLAGLYIAIARRHGGHDRWARKLNLPRRSWPSGSNEAMK